MNEPKFIINPDGTVESYHPDKITPPKKDAGFARPPVQFGGKLVQCPTCQRRIHDLADHLRKTHGQEISEIEAALADLELPSDPREFVACPYCKARMRRKRFVRHLFQVHGLKKPFTKKNDEDAFSASDHSAPPPIPEIASSSRKLIYCPYCRVKVRVDRLQKHLRKLHRSKLKLYANFDPKSINFDVYNDESSAAVD